MIPKIIHYCWFGGAEMPAKYKNYIEKCKTINPTYKIIIWNEDNFDLSINQYAKEAYDNRKWAFVTDYVRLKVLYDQGGIYMDTDVEVIKKFDSFLEYPAFTGFEGIDRIPTGTMGAEKGNIWIGKLLAYYDDKHFVNEDGSFDLTTNVTTITDITSRMMNITLNNTLQEFEYAVFFPFEVFCAKDILDGSITKTPNTVTIHHFEGSWMPPKKRAIKRLTRIIGYKNIERLVRIKRMVWKQ